MKQKALRRLSYLRHAAFASEVAPGVQICPARELVPTEAESAFLQRCAEYSQFASNQSYRIRQAPIFLSTLRPASIFGDTGGIAYMDILLIDSLLHRQKSLRSSAYRTPRWLRVVEKQGRYSSVFYAPECWNTYHWLADCLPRLYALGTAQDKPLTLVCPAGLPPVQRDMLVALTSDMPHVELAWIGPKERWDVEEYVFSSFASDLNSPVFAPPVLEFLRRGLYRLGESAGSSATRRVFVTRAGASRRRLLNESNVAAALTRCGFATVELEKLSAAQQIALFRGADCVVGVHGAGLTNLLLSEHAVVVELQAADFPKSHYLLLCKGGGLDYHRVEGSRMDANEDFSLDPDALLALLSRLNFGLPRASQVG